MADSPHVKINLIGKPKESFSAGLLHWAITAGRIIIIVTELIALGALFYRFTLDRKIIDLHDKIDKASLLVKAQAAKEKDYRSIQERLNNINVIEKETNKKIGIMNQILESVNSGNFSATNLTINNNSISINGSAFSIFPVNDFVEYMKTNPSVSSISLDDVSSSTQGVQFKVSLELKESATNIVNPAQKNNEKK